MKILLFYEVILSKESVNHVLICHSRLKRFFARLNELFEPLFSLC